MLKAKIVSLFFIQSVETTTRTQLQFFRDYWFHYLETSKEDLSIKWKSKIQNCTKYCNTTKILTAKIDSHKDSFKLLSEKFQLLSNDSSIFSEEARRLCKQKLEEDTQIFKKIEDNGRYIK